MPDPSWTRRVVAIATAVASVASAPVAARAQTARGDRLVRNDFDVQIFQGPIVAPNRIIGLAGANAADPEGVTGDYANAAAPAVRTPWSERWLDYDLTGGVSFPGAFSRTDFDNRGEAPSGSSSRFGSFFQLNGGGTLQFGRFGMSATADLQSFTLDSSVGGLRGVDLRLFRAHVLAAYALLDHQLVIGGGLRAITLQISEGFPISRALLTMTGVGPQIGVLVRPNDFPFRVGATFRSPVSGRIVGTDLPEVSGDFALTVGDYVLPNRVRMPWELEVGGAFQLGPRPLNPRWIDPSTLEAAVRTAVENDREARRVAHERARAIARAEDRAALDGTFEREDAAVRVVEDARLRDERRRVRERLVSRYANWPRERVLLVASVVATGGESGAVSVQGFLDQTSERYGRNLTLSPRVGIESEPIAHTLRARVGSYFEPSRFEGGVTRQHFTFGGDIRLFDFDPFDWWGDFTLALTFSLDLAPRFTNWGVGLGAWH